MKALTILSILSTSFLSTNALAGEGVTLSEALTNGDPYINLRYRIEFVDQDGLANTATASTLRTVLGYKTGTYKGISAVLEFENISSLGDDAYNSTLNGKGDRPVIPDPEATEVNQAYLKYTGIDKAELFAGRKAFKLANQRLLGPVGWRQNFQTLDLVGGKFIPTKDLTFNYAYIWNINRILGDDHSLGDFDTNTHVASIDYTGLPFGKFNAYALLTDINNAVGLSTQTYGASLSGKYKISNNTNLNYYGEYARQSNYVDNPTSFNADYIHINGKVSNAGLEGKIGYEVLGSNNGRGYATPLATIHVFNGWADKFIATPKNGLEDFYAGVSYKILAEGPLKGLKFEAIYHDFSADTGGSYGSEIDLLAVKKIDKHVYTGIKFASYTANGFATDTQKIWFTLGANY